MSGAQVSPADRLIFTLVVMLILHGFVLLGVTFTVNTGEGSPAVQEITVSLMPGERPEETDFIAADDQTGSGDDVRAEPLSSPQEAEFPANRVQPVMPEPLAVLAARSEQRLPLVATSGESGWSLPAEDATVSVSEAESPLDLTQLTTADIATLRAMLEERQQQYAERPRVRTLTAVSARAALEADYILDWQQAVERIGNANYPRSARADRLSGDVRLLTRINPDGSLQEVRLLDSSGHNVLDQAAQTIIELAAPFPPFPQAMRASFDVLEVIRTLRFEVDGEVRAD